MRNKHMSKQRARQTERNRPKENEILADVLSRKDSLFRWERLFHANKNNLMGIYAPEWRETKVQYPSYLYKHLCIVRRRDAKIERLLALMLNLKSEREVKEFFAYPGCDSKMRQVFAKAWGNDYQEPSWSCQFRWIQRNIGGKQRNKRGHISWHKWTHFWNLV